jgi:hypothetical protein
MRQPAGPPARWLSPAAIMYGEIMYEEIRRANSPCGWIFFRLLGGSSSGFQLAPVGHAEIGLAMLALDQLPTHVIGNAQKFTATKIGAN